MSYAFSMLQRWRVFLVFYSGSSAFSPHWAESLFPSHFGTKAQFSADGAVVNGVSHDDLYALWCRIVALPANFWHWKVAAPQLSTDLVFWPGKQTHWNPGMPFKMPFETFFCIQLQGIELKGLHIMVQSNGAINTVKMSLRQNAVLWIDLEIVGQV